MSYVKRIVVYALKKDFCVVRYDLNFKVNLGTWFKISAQTFTSSSLAKGGDPRYFSITFQSEPGFASTDYVHFKLSRTFRRVQPQSAMDCVPSTGCHRQFEIKLNLKANMYFDACLLI